MQAMNILTQVKDVEVVRRLDQLQPNRDATGFLLSESLAKESHFAFEAYKHSLPRDGVTALAMEEDKGTNLNDVVNLSVGKMINIEITVPGANADAKPVTVRIPVNFRLMTSSIPTGSLVRLLTHSTDDNSLVERFHAWRAGRISFIKDLIFCQDLIDEYRSAAINDKTNTLGQIVARVNANKRFGLLTKNPSLASASNIFVITEENAKEVEAKLGGKLANPATRAKVFENTYAMILAVVDREWNRVTYYIRGCEASSDFSFKEIAAASKTKGPDVMDMMRALTQRSQLSF